MVAPLLSCSALAHYQSVFQVMPSSNESSGRFSGKVALISGASSGLGKACAVKLLTEGAHVLAVARDSAKLAELERECDSPRLKTLATNLAEPSRCRAAVEAAVAEFSVLDVLLNVAGVHRFRHTHSMSEQDWQDDLAINLNAPFFLAQAAIPHLLKRKGNIVNIGSLASTQGQPYSASYCAAKHGLIGLTRALAMEFLKTDLRVNAVCPGGMNTPQIQNIQFADDMDFDLIMRSSTERGIMEADDVSTTVAFLASDEAKAVHGAVYQVDQGRTVG
ncbi:MAG: meso-butanediol dehydrogenase/(S,S)-butanediol dehydrogenase/diacetyl reductase [Bermanella sp.]